MKYKKLEVGTNIFFILLGIMVLAVSRDMGKEGTFPAIVAIGMILSAAASLIVRRKAAEDILDLSGMNLPRVALTAVLIAAYIFLMPYIGYVIASILLGAAVMLILGYKRVPIAIVVASITAGACFCVFKLLLTVPLPTAFLDL